MNWDIAQPATGFGPVGYSRQADQVMERIRERAHALWEAHGKPDGGQGEFWQRAEAEIVGEISLR